MKELIASNLSGKFSWKKYCKPGNHDSKFGPTKLEYLCQIPVFGLVPTATIFGSIWVLLALIKLINGGK